MGSIKVTKLKEFGSGGSVYLFLDQSQESELIMKHVNALAYMNYSSLNYEWQSKTLRELACELNQVQHTDIDSGVLNCASHIAQQSKAGSKFPSILFFLKPAVVTKFIKLYARITNSKVEIHSNQIDKIVYGNHFLYENLANWNLYDVRLLDKEIVTVTLDIRNYCAFSSIIELMDAIEPQVTALKELWLGGMFSSTRKLILEIFVERHSKSETADQEYLQKQIILDDIGVDLDIRIQIGLCQCELIDKMTNSDIQVLPITPTQLSLATAILQPSKMVLVDATANIKLRNWTRY